MIENYVNTWSVSEIVSNQLFTKRGFEEHTFTLLDIH